MIENIFLCIFKPGNVNTQSGLTGLDVLSEAISMTCGTESMSSIDIINVTDEITSKSSSNIGHIVLDQDLDLDELYSN